MGLIGKENLSNSGSRDNVKSKLSNPFDKDYIDLAQVLWFIFLALGYVSNELEMGSVNHLNALDS